jgi:translation initiation factor IF-1
MRIAQNDTVQLDYQPLDLATTRLRYRASIA